MLESTVSFHHYFDFLILYEFADLFKFFKCRLYIKDSRKSTANGLEYWDITETNNWIRLLNFDEKTQFLFSQKDPEQLISLM